LCFERRFSKQNSVIRVKSSISPPSIFGPHQIFGLATPLRAKRIFIWPTLIDSFSIFCCCSSAAAAACGALIVTSPVVWKPSEISFDLVLWRAGKPLLCYEATAGQSRLWSTEECCRGQCTLHAIVRWQPSKIIMKSSGVGWNLTGKGMKWTLEPGQRKTHGNAQGIASHWGAGVKCTLYNKRAAWNPGYFRKSLKTSKHLCNA